MKLKKNIFSCSSGGTLLFVALMFPLLLLIVAVAVDIARLYAVKSQAQSASDAALMGAVATENSCPGDPPPTEAACVSSEMPNLFAANYPASYMGGTVGTIAVSEAGDGVWQANFTVDVPTTIMGYFGTAFTTLNIQSQVTEGFATVEQRRLELALVLDNTGSMANGLGGGGGSKIAGLRTAASDLTNILFGSSSTLPNVHMSIIPFDVDVNLPGHIDWVQTAYRPQYSIYVTLRGIGPLANRNRDDPPNSLNDISDAPPGDDTTRFRIPNNAPHVSCSDTPTPGMAQLSFYMNNKQDILNVISTMQAGGCTRINVGLMWGWFTLSQKWQGVWSGLNPDAPETPNANLDKQIVLMTDGLNTVFFGAAGASNDDNTTSLLCSAIKAQGITIYTIGFGTPGDINEPLLRNCASRPNFYFNAPTVAQLQTVFHQIADVIKFTTLRLSK